MRISDWSSDVCSSDLDAAPTRRLPPQAGHYCRVVPDPSRHRATSGNGASIASGSPGFGKEIPACVLKVGRFHSGFKGRAASRPQRPHYRRHSPARTLGINPTGYTHRRRDRTNGVVIAPMVSPTLIVTLGLRAEGPGALGAGAQHSQAAANRLMMKIKTARSEA